MQTLGLRPPWRIPGSAPLVGEFVAVNVDTGDMTWRVPLGFVEALDAKGIKNTDWLLCCQSADELH